jgi:hypothetical protein
VNVQKPAVDWEDANATFLSMRAVLFAAVMICSGCSDVCQNTVASRSVSPDGQHGAILFQRDCGATTGCSTQISVLDTGGNPSGSGNTFIADDDHGAARVGDWGGSWAETKGLSADRLLVRYAAKTRLFKQNKRVSNVSIVYQPVES